MRIQCRHSGAVRALCGRNPESGVCCPPARAGIHSHWVIDIPSFSARLPCARATFSCVAKRKWPKGRRPRCCAFRPSDVAETIMPGARVLALLPRQKWHARVASGTALVRPAETGLGVECMESGALQRSVEGRRRSHGCHRNDAWAQATAWRQPKPRYSFPTMGGLTEVATRDACQSSG